MNTTARDSLSRVREARPDVYALAMLASLSPRITPDYLRELRLELGAEAYHWALRQNKSGGAAGNHPPDANSEASLWFNPLLIRGHGPEGIALHPEIAQLLQVALKDSELLAKAAGALEEHCRSLPPELKWQAELSTRLLEGNDQAVGGLEEQMLATLRDPGQQQLARTVAYWLLRDVHPSLPDLRRIPLALVSEIAAGTLTNLELPLLQRAKGRHLEGLQKYDLTGWVSTTEVMVRRLGGELWISDKLKQPTCKLEIPQTNPFVISVQTDRKREEVLPFFPGGKPAYMEVGVGPVVLRDIFGRVFRLDERRDPPLSPAPLGELHRLMASGEALVGREAELADLRAWLIGGEAVMALVGPAGRGKQRLSEEVASEFRGKHFIGHTRDTKGFARLLFNLAEFLRVVGPWALPQAAVSPTGRTLIVLQGLAYEDFQNEQLTAFIAALRRQSVIKLLLTGESAPPGLPTREIPTLAPAAVEAALRDSVPSADARRRLARASTGEPLVVQLLRATARELGVETAETIAASFGPNDDIAAKTGRVVAALMQRSPTRYVDIIGDLAVAKPVADALKETYQRVESSDPDLKPLIVWCDDRRDHRVRQAILAEIDDDSRLLPSRNMLALLERLAVWTPTDDMVHDWPFWPAVANTLAQVLRRRDDATSSILQGLLARDISRWRQEQILQIALPKSGLIAAGDPLALQLARHLWELSTEKRKAHRQGAWTLMKDVHSTGEAREALERFTAVDYWARTRLIISLVQLSPAEKEALGLLGSGDAAYEFLLEPANAYFTALLLLWAKHPRQRQFDLTTVFRLPDPSVREDTLAERLGLPADHLFLQTADLLAPPVADDERMARVTRDVVGQYLQGAVSASELQVFADLVSLQIEVGRDTSDRPLRRYDVFETFTKDALVAAGPRALDIVKVLAQCLDEGVRWGVAQRFKPAYTKAAVSNRGEQVMPSLYRLVTPEEYWAAARTMASDENEWVVRDTIGGVAESWPSIPRNADDAAGAAALAEPAHDWIVANFHRGDEQLFDVQSNIELLQAVCPPFAERWKELIPIPADWLS